MTSLGRLRYIDGLRAVAVLAVVADHAHQHAPHAGRFWLDRLGDMGAHGVDLFFVLSGFCLSYPYLNRGRESGIDVAAFLMRRAIRIVPPFYAAVALFAIVYALLGLHSPGLGFVALAQQFLFLDRDQSYLSSAFWTLAVELRWYLWFPLALALFVRSPRGTMLLAAAGYVAYYFTRLDAVDVGTMPAFLLGIVAAGFAVRDRPATWAGFAALWLAALAFLFERSGGAYYAVEPIGVLACFAFVVFCGRSGAARRVLEWPPLVICGIASYSIYLVHLPVLEYLEEVRHAAWWVAVPIALACSFAFYALCERPFVHGPLRARLFRSLEAPVAGATRWLTAPSFASDVVCKQRVAEAPRSFASAEARRLVP